MCDSILEGSSPVNGSFPVVPQSSSWRILYEKVLFPDPSIMCFITQSPNLETSMFLRGDRSM